ncbi:MAG: 3-hydroxyacyl-CoA dehydrogenase NAD-binding domain-containing protein [Bacteroidota bacterium]|nr:3-hydroxyacyl-CoA dehydrogenase NAD-binding domain-containing protein [Bacteroidota bacterium]
MEQSMTVGVIGAGTMGQGIAQIAASAGHDVLLVDRDEAAMERALANLDRILKRLVEKGRLAPVESDDILSRIRTSSELTACAPCGLVIEAVVEKEDVKQTVFASLESIVGETTILATNTSSLSVTRLAAGLAHPSRFLGLHFFNPAPLLPLVEVVPALQTRQGLAEEMAVLMRSWGKQPAIAKDTPGFIVNRVARPFYGEAIRIHEEGIADIATIDWAMTELGGFRMGPFQLMDLIGNDINYAVTESVWKAFHHDPRYTPSFSQKRNVDAGWLGRKTGRGWHDHTEGAPVSEPRWDKDLGQDILWRILVMLINEAADAVFWGVASAEDVDRAMKGGVNYPKGLLEWAEEVGLDRCVQALDDLRAEYGEERYRCSPLLRRCAEQQRGFFN